VGIRVGIDTGGTFTDLVAVDDESGTWSLAKVPSNAETPVAAIQAALVAAGLDPGDVSFIVVATTLGINAVLTRSGARVVFVTTKGFEDIPFIQRISRKYHYDYRWRKPRPLLDRQDCLGVSERLDEEGNELAPLDADELERLVRSRLNGNGAAGSVAVAVCYLFSYLNPDHEAATARVLASNVPASQNV